MAHLSTAVPTSTASCPTACFIWKTEKPFSDVSRKSCDFSLLGAEWWLEAKCSYTGTVPERNRIDITTILEFNTSNQTSGRIAYYKHQFPVQEQTESVLWEHYKTYIVSHWPSFDSKGAWKIICVFHDIPAPVLKIDVIKVDSSTQVDVVTSTTAEQCTQVSRDFSDMDKLSEDLSSLLRLSLYPDAKLRCGDRTVPVHRSLLAARSPVFDTMFQDESTDVFDVTDLDDNTFDLFLEYAYTGTIHALSDGTAVGLYEAGQKYAMDSLRKACSDWMILHLTMENCVSFLDAANSSDDGTLEEAVSSFLCVHPNVFKSQSWNRFAEQQPSLAYKLIHMYAFRGI